MKKVTLLLSILISSCANSDKKIAEQIDQLFLSEFRPDQPGAAVLVMKDGKVIFEKGYGIADIATKEKITTETLFNTGSISKTFVSNTILSLADEGKLSLNDSLSKYFHDFKNQKIANRIKIHHLLTHTSGLPDNRRDLLEAVYLLTAKDEENWYPIEQNDSLLFEPGSRFEYSNPAFNGLALIIEKVTKKKWQDVVAEKIFKPSGMTASKITDGAYPENGVAHGYIDVLGEFSERDYGEEPTFAAAGNGGVWSSVKELAKYEMALRNGVFFKKDLVEHSRSIMRYSQWADSVPPFIGYSWFIGKTEDGAKMISHTGTQGGFHADYVSIPEKGVLYVVLCNRPFPREEFRKKVFEIMGVRLQNLVIPK
ncbi:MAG: beta-lactamase family protein [Bacteroidetes bacterium]|nr:beta-lactamase family protein [Bacteroidota bacterium]MBI3483325.1 beta-lactamase family protein [Bacteroidota bacterium]